MAQGPSKSVALTQQKARIERIKRLKLGLDQKLDNPIVAIDVLMGEIVEGDPQTEMWEALHAAAMRDKLEASLADAYSKCVNGPRMKRMPPAAQADVLMHAADFAQGILGDPASAETYLRRVLTVVPGHAEAYARLERRFDKLLEPKPMLELLAAVATTPPASKNETVLANQTFHRLLQLTAKDPLGDEMCRTLLAYVPHNARVLDALETHCRQTKRFALACELLEQVVNDHPSDALTIQRRHKLVELYLGDAATPAAAIGHVEALLANDATDAIAFKACERLLSTLDVASRAAAALQTARRTRGY